MIFVDDLEALNFIDEEEKDEKFKVKLELPYHFRYRSPHNEKRYQ